MCVATAVPAAGSETQAPWPSRIAAVYGVSLAGVELGQFHYRSEVDRNAYRLAAHAKLSWGFGMFSWKSDTSSSGFLSGNGIRPGAYTLDYKSSKKVGRVRLKFDTAGVTAVDLAPPAASGPDIVPLAAAHLKAVFDPMSALIALARVSGGNPCGRRIAIFDGKQRFDLALSFRRQERVKERRPSGQPPLAYVCGIRYIPIAGYRRNAATRSMADSKGIEVAMRPVPAANIAVPIRITMALPVGSVQITLKNIDITAPDNSRIALSQ